MYKVNVKAGNEELIEEMVQEVSKQDYVYDSQEKRPDTEVTRTKEEFPSTYEMDDDFVIKMRKVIASVLKQWASEYEDIQIPLSFDDDDVSRAFYH